MKPRVRAGQFSDTCSTAKFVAAPAFMDDEFPPSWRSGDGASAAADELGSGSVDGRGYGGGSWGGNFGGAFARYGPDYLWPEGSYGENRRGYELLCTGGHGYDGAGLSFGVPSGRMRVAAPSGCSTCEQRKRGLFKRAVDVVVLMLVRQTRCRGR
jgi:hypothetical protein